jgi:hypothetical protein
VLLYRWNYSWKEIKKLYSRKQKIYLERREVDYEFIVKIAQACMGGGKSDDGAVGLDDGSMLEEMSDEQIADMKEMLGEDFAKLYNQEPETEEEQD